MPLDVLKVFVPTVVAFTVGIIITPLLTHYLYKYKLWKKKSVSVATDGGAAIISQSLHQDEERQTPRMGGVVVWGSGLLTIGLFWLLAEIDGAVFAKLNFLSRNQTWLTVFTLSVGAIIGLVDDYFSVTEHYDQPAGGLSFWKRLGTVLLVALAGAWWFYAKLEVTSILIPFVGEWNIGWLFVPFFVVVMLAVYSGGVIDGLDGLSGGVFSSIFSAYGTIAFLHNQIDLAAFCFVIVGGLLAFLWFNIPPARFFMSETGMMALTMTLAVVAFLTKEIILLPVIAFPLVMSSASSSIQLLSKRLRGGKKVFLVAPLHHHFQARGWPHYKVTMRYWIIGVISAILGIVLSLISQ